MIRWLGRLSLSWKLTLLATATSAVSMAVLVAVIGSHDAATLRVRLVKETEVLLDMIGATSRTALSREDSVAATDLLRATGVNQHITVAALILPDGTMLGRYARWAGGDGDHVPQFDALAVRRGERWHEFRSSTLAMARPVLLDDRALGTVYVEMSLVELRERLVRLWLLLGAALGGVVLLAGVVGWRLQRIISSPLVLLTTIIRSVTRDRNYSLRAPVLGQDEIGELLEGFNDMLDDIQRRDAALELQREQLEKIVAARTSELKASVNRYRLLVESTHAVPWEVVGATWKFSYISPQASKLIGYPSDVVIDGMSFSDLLAPEDRPRVLERLSSLVEAGAGDLDLEYRVLTASDAMIDVRSVATAQRLNTGEVVLRGITLDVTAQKRLELELRQAQKLESVGRLAAGVAHEINTPIQFVSDSVHFVRDAVNDLPAVLAAYEELRVAVAEGRATADGAALVQQAAEAADLEYVVDNVPKALERSLEGLGRVATIVRSMKEFAHPDQKEMAPVDLNQAIMSTLIIARNEYKYVADVETDLGDLPSVVCHGGEVNQVLLNVIVNAAHAIEDVVKGTDRKGLITIQTRHEGATVVVRISDTGGGIPESAQERVFDPFFTTKPVGRGTGQGLAIARSVIVDKHHGDLMFETRQNSGTTFIVRLPVSGGAAAAGAPAASAHPLPTTAAVASMFPV